MEKKSHYVFNDDEPLPEQVAKALREYIAKYGPPPPMTESISVEVGRESVVIKEFSVKETA